MAGLACGVPPLLRRAAWGATRESLRGSDSAQRVLVVVELAGGNDGLNTLVPIRHDAYYAARPKLAIARETTLRLDDAFGLHPSLVGLHNLFEAGQAAVIHGCGYPRPDRSHFTSMRYWHTGRPHRAEPFGWVGRLADEAWPAGRTASLVNLGQRESPAVRSRSQAPIVFADPADYVRRGDPSADETYGRLLEEGLSQGETLSLVRHLARTASETQERVRAATSRYETPVSYGVPFPTLTRDLRNVAALLADDFPARIFYVSFGGFDTHAAQAGQQQLLLQYFADAVEGFHKDLERIGLDAEVLTLAFTEFGRRVAENRSVGTDHGTATPMWLFGKPVVPGLHGRFPELEDLDAGDLRFTTDFRQVYAAALRWMGSDPAAVLGPGFPPLRGLLPS